MDKLGMRATVCLNSEIIREYPRIVEEALASNWAFIGHGINNAPANFIGNAPDGQGGHTPLSEEREREIISTVCNTMEEAIGRKTKGWLSPFLTHTDNTFLL